MLLIIDVLLERKMGFLKIIMIKNFDLYFIEFWWVFFFEDWKLGREDKFGGKNVLGKINYLKINVLGGGGREVMYF